MALGYDEILHFSLKRSLKIGKITGGKVAAGALTVVSGGAAAPWAAKLYATELKKEQDKHDAKREAQAQAIDQQAAWAAEERRSAAWRRFWTDWEAMLGVRERVGYALADVDLRYDRLRRRSSAKAWPVTFDDSMDEARVELKEAKEAIKNAPPLTFTSPSSELEEIQEAHKALGVDRAAFETALRKIGELAGKIRNLEARASENESADRIKAMRSRFLPSRRA